MAFDPDAQDMAGAALSGRAYDATARAVRGLNASHVSAGGDSLIAGADGLTGSVTKSLRSNSRYRLVANYGVGGTRTDQIRATQLPMLLADNSLRVLLNGGTNDMAQDSVGGDAAARANLVFMFAALRGVGKSVFSQGLFPNTTTSKAILFAKHELWRQQYCARNNIPHVHVWPKLANPDGTWKAGYNFTADDTHPSAIGRDLVAAEILNTFSNPAFMAQFGALIDSDNPNDLFANAVSFGGVAPALPAGWSVQGAGGAYDVIAPDAGDYGNWLRTTFTSAVTAVGVNGSSRTLAQLAWNPGDKIAVAARVRCTTTSQGSLKARIANIGTALVTPVPNYPVYFDDILSVGTDDAFVYTEATISASAAPSDTLRYRFTATTTDATTQTMSIQRPLIYNLTQNGFA
jgi:lysophospholipase L1-like esterase